MTGIQLCFEHFPLKEVIMMMKYLTQLRLIKYLIWSLISENVNSKSCWMHLETQFIKFSPAEPGVGQAAGRPESLHTTTNIFHLGIIC